MKCPILRVSGILLLAIASAQAQQTGTVLPSPFSASRAGGNAAAGGFVIAPGEILQVLVTADIAPTALSAKILQANGTSLDVPIFQVSSYSPCGGILTVFNQPCRPVAAVTIQIPYGILTDHPGPEFHQASAIVFFNSNVARASALVTPLDDSIRVLTNCLGGGPQPVNPSCVPLVTHSDGTPGYPRPFAPGETVVIYATGLGRVNPAVADGTAPAAAAATAYPTWVDFNFRPNAQAVSPVLPFSSLSDGYFKPSYAGVTPGYPGLYQINVQLPPVPTGLPACGGKVASNLTLTIIGTSSFDAAPICVVTP